MRHLYFMWYIQTISYIAIPRNEVRLYTNIYCFLSIDATTIFENQISVFITFAETSWIKWSADPVEHFVAQGDRKLSQHFLPWGMQSYINLPA